MGKLMAIDYGEKRVGVASTDESGTFAIPRAVWQNNLNLKSQILEFVREQGIQRVVMGESKNLKGEPNPIQEKINTLKAELEEEGIEVILHPEVLTTMEARQIQGNTDMTDASAAALILKSYLETGV